MKVLKVLRLAQAHDSQHRGHRPFARSQDRADQQDLNVPPNTRRKDWCKRRNQSKIFTGQSKQQASPWSEGAIAYPAFSFL